MNDEESSQSAELNSDHRDIDPRFGARLGGFVIAHQSPLTHQPAEGALHYPAARQDFETGDVVRTFDDRDGQLGSQSLHPLGEGGTRVTPIHPQDAQPGEPAQDPAQQDLGAGAFRGVGRPDTHPDHQPQSTPQQMPLAAFDPLAGVIADLPAVTCGFDTLTIQHRSRGPAAFGVGVADERAQTVVDRGARMVSDPLPEDMIDRFPMGKVGGQIAPRATTLDQIQDRVNDAPPIYGWTSTFGSFGQHRFEVSPLGLRKTGVIYGVFHAPTEAALKIRRQTPNRMSTHPSTFLLRRIKNLIIQTHSNTTVAQNIGANDQCGFSCFVGCAALMKLSLPD